MTRTVLTDNTFVNWLRHHPQLAGPEVLQDQSNARTPEAHIMRWTKKPAGFAVEHRFPSSCTSGSSRDGGHAPQHLKRDYVNDYDTDEERPR